MTDTVQKAAEILKEHRNSIDRLDAILVYTLGERFKHTQAVGKLKRPTISHHLIQPVKLTRLLVWKTWPNRQILILNSQRSF